MSSLRTDTSSLIVGFCTLAANDLLNSEQFAETSLWSEGLLTIGLRQTLQGALLIRPLGHTTLCELAALMTTMRIPVALKPIQKGTPLKHTCLGKRRLVVRCTKFTFDARFIKKSFFVGMCWKT